MSPEDATAVVQGLEKKCDLLQYAVDNWCIWPLLRFKIIRSLESARRDTPAISLKRTRIIPIVLADIWELARLSKVTYVAKTYNSARTEKEGGVSKDIYFDDLLSQLNEFFKIESINSLEVFHAADATLIKRNISTVFLTGLAARLSRLRRPSSETLEAAKMICSSVNSGLGETILSSDAVVNRIHGFIWLKKTYRWLFQRLRPSFLLIADCGEYPIVAAAKEEGIRVIELQHGFLSRSHAGYSWPQYAKPYKNRMPIPDQLFLYGEHWASELRTDGFWLEELRSVGSPRIDNYRGIKLPKEEICTLLLTTQGIDTVNLTRLISEFFAIVEGKQEIQLYIKFHPVYDVRTDLYENAFGNIKNVHLVHASESPSTFELMKRSHLHLSIFSTCHYEALALGVPTVILKLSGYENVLHLQESGDARVASSPRELAAIVARWRELKMDEHVSRKYFEPNAVANMKDQMQSLLSQKIDGSV